MTVDLELLAEETRRVVRERWADPSLCILSTAVLCRAASYFGIPAVPVPVLATALNPVCAQWIADGRDIIADEQECYEAGGRFVQTVTDPSLAGFGGHLLAQVDSILVDADFGQFSRPAKQMPLPDTIVVDTTGSGWPTKPVTFPIDGSMIIYAPQPDPPDWRHAPDWQDRKAKPLAGQVIRNLRAAVE